MTLEYVCAHMCVCVCANACCLYVYVSSGISLGLFVEPQLSGRPGTECWEYKGRLHTCGRIFMELMVTWKKADVYKSYASTMTHHDKRVKEGT